MLVTKTPGTALTSINETMLNAFDAFNEYKKVLPEQKAIFLETIANEIEALGDTLINKASEETNLPAARLTGERARTTMQLRMFAAMVREGSWVEASIDTSIPDRYPVPKSDIRKMLIPLGPVIVFGASNFPFAYSTAGGDTASALAAGCSVVVKAHPAHAETSIMVYEAIKTSIKKCGMPSNVFQHVNDEGFETGKALVQHPATAAVGFTGSFSGGKALYDYAFERKNPIPVFSEMGSINPVIFFPDTLEKNSEELVKMYAGSVTLGMGQFCTNPGLMIAIESDALNIFLENLSEEVSKFIPSKMLHEGIQQAYIEKMEKALSQKGVTLIKKSTYQSNGIKTLPAIASVSGETFLKNPTLHEEVFGPYSLMVKCKDVNELKEVWQSVAGQLTTSLMGTDKDFNDHKELIEIAPAIAGRINFNNPPTGVEVCPSMVHGGPFPATTDSRYTAVGINGVKRWVRPICFQNCPEYLLPEELKNKNPRKIMRLINNQHSNGDVE
ncbi:aldehyde dehydrogenase (NADP(+)) [Ginsengibacter hankyongi]|uniref:Aldehyde dehydrogenase (NADP(+)) n=1 Tax=Ginsengibacter hankyongi TaxID=2607284 RepID=A0A5J5IFX6_9BACT|nr:aldehyde dehydrogenase (NADP(+)) [Ginsengibacter hankyongi]KAA9039094.1 aldehyde dehydrogenase (NADP(+)) [Ginsengibacter hankyongi]